MVEVTVETLVNNVPVASHVRVSDAQVVTILSHVSPDLTLETLVSEVVGFDTFTIAVISTEADWIYRNVVTVIIVSIISKVSNHFIVFFCHLTLKIVKLL